MITLLLVKSKLQSKNTYSSHCHTLATDPYINKYTYFFVINLESTEFS